MKAATGPMEREERDVEEEQERQAHLRCAQAHLRYDDEDHTRASVVLPNIVPPISAPISAPFNADSSAAAPAGCGLLLATGFRESVERGEEEEAEDKRQVQLRRARDQLKWSFEDEDYTGAAFVQDHLGALVRGQPLSQCNPGRSKADRFASTATGHRSQPATGRTVTSAVLALGAAGNSIEKEFDDE